MEFCRARQANLKRPLPGRHVGCHIGVPAIVSEGLREGCKASLIEQAYHDSGQVQ